MLILALTLDEMLCVITKQTSKNLNQERFSELIKSFLVEKLNEFIKSINNNDDKYFGCDLRNSTNEFFMLFATYNA